MATTQLIHLGLYFRLFVRRKTAEKELSHNLGVSQLMTRCQRLNLAKDLMEKGCSDIDVKGSSFVFSLAGFLHP